jgi:zinc-binding in reverse transcriptase
VRSCYTFIQNQPFVSTQLAKIWQLKAPPKILIFTWLLLRYSILTVDNLKKCGWQLPNRCIMCLKDEESIEHLFQECEFAKEIRTYVHDNTQNHTQPSLRYRMGDIAMIVDKTESSYWRRLELITDFVL